MIYPEMDHGLAIRFELPIRTVSGMNVREHWAKRAKRVRSERSSAYLLCPQGVSLPCTLRLTRIAPRPLDRHDNLKASMKHVIDGLCDRIGVKDNDWRLMFEYDQRKDKPKEYGVIVEITSYSQVEPHLRATT